MRDVLRNFIGYGHMPTVPAYVNVALLLGPLLANLGVSFFTAHMFAFYFAVASTITPPVAIAMFLQQVHCPTHLNKEKAG